MSVKTPIVASNSSAIPEVVENYKSGILYNKKDKESFVKSVEKILFNKKFKKSLTNNAFRRLNTKFSITKMYKKTNLIYQKILN